MIVVATYNRNQHSQYSFSELPVVIGRSPSGSTNRLAVDDPHVSDNQCLVRIDSQASRVILTNLGHSLALPDGIRLHRGKSVTAPLPVTICMGDTFVQILDPAMTSPVDVGLKTLAALDNNLTPDQILSDDIDPSKRVYGVGTETLSSWFETIGVLHRQVAGSKPFFEAASRAIFNPGGLDGGIIFLLKNGQWEIVASHLPYPEFGVSYRHDLLEQSIQHQQVIYHHSADIQLDHPANDLHSAVILSLIHI